MAMPGGAEAWRLDLSRPARCSRPVAAWKVAAWSVLFATAFPAGLVAAWSGPFDLTLAATPFVILAWLASGLYAATVTVRLCIRRAWTRVIASAILPVSTVLAALWFGTVWNLAIAAGDDIHFQLMKASYVRTIAAMPREPFRLVIFDWGGLGVSHAVVYDESDQIALAPNERSAEWQRRASGTELKCGVSGSSAGAHFYIVRLGC